MSKHISKLLILLCLIWTLAVQHVSAFSDNEGEKPKSEQTKKNDERVIIIVKEELVEDELCDCPMIDPIYYSPREKIMRTIYKPFKLINKLFKSKN